MSSLNSYIVDHFRNTKHHKQTESHVLDETKITKKQQRLIIFDSILQKHFQAL